MYSEAQRQDANRSLVWFLSLALVVLIGAEPARADDGASDSGGVPRPISLHPDNPHYFLFRGEPTVLITSGEHYGALLNLDFDYKAYFEALARDKLNGTRVFSGAYVETSGNFRIARNTLDPAPGRFICPWARSGVPGYADGGNKFDLTRWDAAYFARLKDLVREAGKHGVIVELNLFCPFYGDSQWNASPMNARNNVNQLGTVGREDVYTLDRSGGLLAIQEALVRRIVRALEGFDNVYLEICNEPYFGGVTMAWQHRIADVIVDEQKGSTHKLLISRNVANGSKKVVRPHPAVSILNFHYATPPDAVAENYGLDRVIGDNETGFRGTQNEPYRMEAWDFIIAGGGLFNHLDYSFTARHPGGTWTDYPSTQPGGGNPTLRGQFRILRDFIHGFDFIRMKPDNTVLEGLPAGASARALVEPGKAYAVYVRRREPQGPYSVRWTGSVSVPRAAEYTFSTFSNDGVRLWIGGEKLIDNWTDHAETEDKGTIHLEAGRGYPLKLEYFYGGGQGTIRLRWSTGGETQRSVPADWLRPPDGSAAGLKGDYFRGKDLKRAWRTRRDRNVDFAWGTKSPFETLVHAGVTALKIRLPRGTYRAEWVNTESGRVVSASSFEHGGDVRELTVPEFENDLALRIRAE